MTTVPARSPYIVGRHYDCWLFIYAPLIAIVIGGLARIPTYDGDFSSWGIAYRGSAYMMFMGVFTTAHLAIVFARTHLNPSIRALYPRRFFAVPLMLLGL